MMVKEEKNGNELLARVRNNPLTNFKARLKAFKVGVLDSAMVSSDGEREWR